ncbi:hypothetical protein SPOG_05684 [Schizosaccharomyces cryophilus OY26]|uniref:Uncharacterized protein n=1 Tax=Schizosaccharomyces cryophilus (strain OY26 / ATCC MYA-4695 / CBS 11777 / NBRC 106824 / NRRL Y48691) TaxID=653667 RepID=S9VZH0_SCHCR|nr:uncharacterized protein SPOG_05684 [Schizosaccharomyces cryophilus OY26]EPY53038.1 hypothetical protein SPOG_05684 [Schizosaccharomyces cryophilus OY26]
MSWEFIQVITSLSSLYQVACDGFCNGWQAIPLILPIGQLVEVIASTWATPSVLRKYMLNQKSSFLHHTTKRLKQESFSRFVNTASFYYYLCYQSLIS